MIEGNEWYDHKVFGANIKRLREERGMTKKALAKELHIGTTTFSNLEKGIMGKRFGAEVLVIIHKFFNVYIEELFDDQFLPPR